MDSSIFRWHTDGLNVVGVKKDRAAVKYPPNPSADCKKRFAVATPNWLSRMKNKIYRSTKKEKMT